mmetsp:Transcript_1027/g.3012  ORF Transcript_1027/g.3012 Transcript_1027/m.3012 type:complete len:331 (-) Transcript_1027:91-1083(-)
MTALTKSLVGELPPTSRVSTLPSPSTVSTARCTRSAKAGSRRWRSIMAADRIMAVGFTTSLPAMSMPTCRAPCSNTAHVCPMLAPGAKPGLPVNPATAFDTNDPYKLGVTITSNCCGRDTNCIMQLSTMISRYSMVGYRLATSRQDSRNRPSAIFMMLALCTAVTLLRKLRYAYSNAYSAMRVVPVLVITLSDSVTPGNTSCSRPLNSPSVFSRTTTMSTSLCRACTPGIVNECTTFAYRSNARFSSTCTAGRLPRPTPAWNSPLIATLSRRIVSSTSFVTRPSRAIRTSSHWMGAPAAPSTFIAASHSSGPMPSPGSTATRRVRPSPGR